MRDSRIGSYGALGLVLAVGLRAALILSLDASRVAIAIIAAATFGRLLVAVAMKMIAPAPRGESLAKDVGANVRARDVVLALVTAIPGLLFFSLSAPVAVLIACVGGGVFLMWFRSLLLRRVGGSTGDCLGFAVYAGQLILLLAATA
jgi:adenosylcobinamide-GDP ribazoletransferase